MSNDIRSTKLIKLRNVIQNSLQSVALFQSMSASCTGFLCWFDENQKHEQAFTLILARHLIPSLSSSEVSDELETYQIYT